MILQCEEWEISECKLIGFFLMNKNKDFTDIKNMSIWVSFHTMEENETESTSEWIL